MINRMIIMIKMWRDWTAFSKKTQMGIILIMMSVVTAFKSGSQASSRIIRYQCCGLHNNLSHEWGKEDPKNIEWEQYNETMQ